MQFSNNTCTLDFLLCRDGANKRSPHVFAKSFEKFCASKGKSNRNGTHKPSSHTFTKWFKKFRTSNRGSNVAYNVSENAQSVDSKNIADFLESKAKCVPELANVPKALYVALAQAYSSQCHSDELENISSFIRSHLEQFSSCSDVELLGDAHTITGVEYQAPTCNSSSCLGQIVVEERCNFVIKKRNQSTEDGTKVQLAVKYAVKKSGNKDTIFDIKTHGLQIHLMDITDPSATRILAEYCETSLNKVKEFYVVSDGKHHPACISSLLPTDVSVSLPDNSNKTLEQKNGIISSLVEAKNNNEVICAVLDFLGHKQKYYTIESTVVRAGRVKHNDGVPVRSSGITCIVKCCVSLGGSSVPPRKISVKYGVDIIDRKFLSLQIRPSCAYARNHNDDTHSSDYSQSSSEPVAHWETFNTIACTSALLEDLEKLWKHGSKKCKVTSRVTSVNIEQRGGLAKPHNLPPPTSQT
ncbi:hypothetical protein [Candidatus Anaplasma sp. TIGMIC]|uniref:hypothetical protein n=1 Tax=Candidatus Anaplasma sp. TIGMIC TaxID=3020713 RepID=UPI00232BA9FB|nr:hypothetical protein [Candidatus Anaplasma sp. TIGMIC]MDB1135561.1 hypothetical protein [Candidatus Anaplasma sp. TIGMIC]